MAHLYVYQTAVPNMKRSLNRRGGKYVTEQYLLYDPICAFKRSTIYMCVYMYKYRVKDVDQKGYL